MEKLTKGVLEAPTPDFVCTRDTWLGVLKLRSLISQLYK